VFKTACGGSDTRYDNEDRKNHKSFIKQAFRGAQYTMEKYCEKESRHINNHANQKINKKY